MAKLHDDCARELLELIPPLMQEIRHGMRGGRGEGLSVPQFRTLAMVAHHPGTSLSAVAAHVGLGAPAMSVIVDGLVRRRLLSRGSAASDRRRSELDLTSSGRSVFDQARKASRRMLAARLTALNDDGVATVASATSLLQTIFTQPSTTPATVHKGSNP